jgi:hypothetical protein
MPEKTRFTLKQNSPFAPCNRHEIPAFADGAPVPVRVQAGVFGNALRTRITRISSALEGIIRRPEMAA